MPECRFTSTALGALRLLTGQEEVHTYHPVCPLTGG